MSVIRIIRFLIIFVLLQLSGKVVSAQGCLINAPQYSLSSDTVSWSLSVEAGHSCTRGVRFSDVYLESLTLLSPPQFGKVDVQGFGFIYSPKADFHGRDSFALALLGAVYRNRGSSTIYVSTFVSPSGMRIAAPPINGTSSPISFTTPLNGATVSGSSVNLTTTVSYAVTSVQFVIGGIDVGYLIGGANIGLAIMSPPYETTWDSTTVADGSYMLHAVAKDVVGNYKIASVIVIVANK